MKKGDALSLPKGWEIKKLIDVVDFQRGLTYLKNDEVDFSNNIVLRSNNVDLKTNKLDFAELKYINPKIVIPENKKVTKGSLIICTANGSKSHLGKVALIDDDYNFAFGGFMGLIKPKKNLNADFLFHAMTSESYKKFIGSLSDGANINNLKFSDLGNFEIPLPPLPEQQRIVTLLDDAFAEITKAKANAEQNLKNAKELFESYLQRVFENKGDDWEEKRFDKICVLQRGFDLPTHSRNEGNFPLVSSNGVTDRIDLWKVKAPGVVTGRSGTIGNVHFIEENYWPLNTALYIKEFHGNYEKYIYYFLRHFDLGKYSSGAGVPTLNRNNVHGEMVWFPKSLTEQQTIVKKLDALSAETKKLEDIYKKKIVDLEELKKSFLQKAFNGKLSEL
jgi:type I restriction enzyme S subunit